MSNEATEVREQIVAAADALFQARGFQAVGMDEIRTAAGVTLRRMYAEFAGKEQLTLAVLSRWHDRWMAGLTQVVTSADTPRARLLAVFDHLRDWSADTGCRGNGFVIALAELGSSSPAVAARVREHDDSFRRQLAALVEAAGLPPELGPQLGLLAEGVHSTAALEAGAGAAAVGREAAARLIAAADPRS